MRSKFFLYVKMLIEFYQKNKERLSKKAHERYKNHPGEEINKKRHYACERYRNLYEEEKEKKRQYGREQYKNLLEDERVSSVHKKLILAKYKTCLLQVTSQNEKFLNFYLVD